MIRFEGYSVPRKALWYEEILHRWAGRWNSWLLPEYYGSSSVPLRNHLWFWSHLALMSISRTFHVLQALLFCFMLTAFGLDALRLPLYSSQHHVCLILRWNTDLDKFSLEHYSNRVCTLSSQSITSYSCTTTFPKGHISRNRSPPCLHQITVIEVHLPTPFQPSPMIDICLLASHPCINPISSQTSLNTTGNQTCRPLKNPSDLMPWLLTQSTMLFSVYYTPSVYYIHLGPLNQEQSCKSSEAGWSTTQRG